MGRNIEIKARAADPKRQQELAAKISDTPCERIEQVDTFFEVPVGRLKLRRFAHDHAELIQYHRERGTGPTRSDYLIVRTSQPDALRALLACALPLRGVVSKKRHLYLSGQTRIHLDDVADLGWFLELEVVLKRGQSDESGRAIANELMTHLEVRPAHLIECSYIDLLLAKRGASAPAASENSADAGSNPV